MKTDNCYVTAAFQLEVCALQSPARVENFYPLPPRTSKNLRNRVTLHHPQTSNRQTLDPASTSRMPHSHCFRPPPAIVLLKTTKISCNVFYRLWKFIQWFISEPTEAHKKTLKQKCKTFLSTLSVSFLA